MSKYWTCSIDWNPCNMLIYMVTMVCFCMVCFKYLGVTQLQFPIENIFQKLKTVFNSLFIWIESLLSQNKLYNYNSMYEVIYKNGVLHHNYFFICRKRVCWLRCLVKADIYQVDDNRCLCRYFLHSKVENSVLYLINIYYNGPNE